MNDQPESPEAAAGQEADALLDRIRIVRVDEDFSRWLWRKVYHSGKWLLQVASNSAWQAEAWEDDGSFVYEQDRPIVPKMFVFMAGFAAWAAPVVGSFAIWHVTWR